jgi:hypothetical protein
MIDTTRTLALAPVFSPLLPDHRYKGAVGGRNGAKSWFFAEQLIETHIAEPFDSVCLREIQKSLQFSSKKLLEGISKTLWHISDIVKLIPEETPKKRGSYKTKL